MIKPRLRVTTLILFLFLIFSIEATLAETWTPGVVEGDFFCYEMYGVFTSSDPNEIIEVSAFEHNITDKVRIDITGVSGSVVHQIYTLYIGNETQKFEFKTDLDPSNTRNLSFPEMGVPICAANLNVGDSLSTVELIVNDALIRNYPSGGREINHVSWNTTLDYGDCYFDRKTGVLVELNRTHLYVNPISNRVMAKVDIVKMTESNFWSAPESPFQVQFSIIAVATLGFGAVSSFCYRERKRKRPSLLTLQNKRTKSK